MLSSVRRMSKSKVGTVVIVLFLLAIVASFALADVSNIAPGGLSSSSTGLAKVGSQEITDRDMTEAMERRLSEVRRQNPEASYADIAGDFDQMLQLLIDERTMQAFADQQGLTLSKRLVDAEIASIPGARGLDGRFSDQAYAAWLVQSRLTDQEVRQIIGTSLLQRLLVAPVAASARVPVGLAKPYASMLLERRRGEVALVAIDDFRSGLEPSAADIQRFYAANQQRYRVPEQRVLRIARMGPEQVAGARATDEEIAAFYRDNQAEYGPSEIRVISQAVVPDEAAARAIAERARKGAAFAAAAEPAGLSAADISVGPQSRAEFSQLAGEAVATAAFGAADGAVIGPIRSDLGWHVVKIDEIRREKGRSLASVRGEIADRLTQEKRANALADLVAGVEDMIAQGASFAEAAAKAGLPVVETPPITASGRAGGNSDYQLPEALQPALRGGFELSPEDEPVVETLANESGYLLVAPARIIPAEPAPLQEIRAQVAADWITDRATQRARQVAAAIATRAGGAALARAASNSPVPIPVEPIDVRRIQLVQFQGEVPPPIAMLFSLGEGKARMVAGAQGEGFYVVKVNKITPGNALTQPGLISQTQQQLEDALSQDYAQQFLTAIRSRVGVRRNEKAIAEAKRRITSGL